MCGATENKAILQVQDHFFAQPGKYQKQESEFNGTRQMGILVKLIN